MKIKNAIFGLVAALLVFGCGMTASADENPAFTAKSISSERKVDVGGGYVSVKISGQYPHTGNALLLSAARQWLAGFLSHANQGEQPIFATPPELLDNGRMLLTRCSNALIRTSEAELQTLEGEEWNNCHEFDISFAPSYISDKLLTYTFSEYIYLGGAHGVTMLIGQTFNAATGEMLTNDSVFLPDKKDELLALIGNALWEQYFKKKLPDENLGAALLIDPDELQLPTGNPQFGERGITFVYQQYEIAPYSMGHPSCTIPYSDLRTLLTPQTLPLLPQKQ